MLRRLCAVSGMLALLLSACALEVGEPEGEDVGQVQQEAKGGHWCMSSADCSPKQHCSTEDGDCLTPPECSKPDVMCPMVCYGRCERDDAVKDECGGCGHGLYCTLCWGSYACVPVGAIC